MRDLRVLVIADGGNLAHWQARALDALGSVRELVVANCTNTRNRRDLRRHAFYYALNLLSIRNRETRLVPVTALADRPTVVDFEARYEGAWQVLPPNIRGLLRKDRFDVAIRFGMNLVRVPPEAEIPILSYHHGDPAAYRGRPAGFWETLHGGPLLGQVVQRLENRLDAGALLAFAETRVVPWSYRATLLEAFRTSPLLLRQAVRNALEGRGIERARDGRNYRLPGNATVLRFAAKLMAAKARHLLYGLGVEKEWDVYVAARADPKAMLANSTEVLDGAVRLPRRREHAFQADPFFAEGGRAVLAEALVGRTGKGEIVRHDLASGAFTTRLPGSAHFSSPAVLGPAGSEYVLPEVANWSPPLAFPLCDGRAGDPLRVDVEDGTALLDPTPFAHEGRHYLFANLAAAGTSVLKLWVADEALGPYRLHPASPILISPRGGRMAGGLYRSHDGTLWRFGQNGARKYGDGVEAFRVELLSPAEYRERRAGSIRFSTLRGPHTLNFDSEGRVLFDAYRERVAPLAGWRRLRARLP